MSNLLITMPCYNEEDGISSFISELDEIFKDIDYTILVLNDCSTDDTLLALTKLKKNLPNLRVFSNEVNLGHGPTTVKGMQYGLDNNFSFILTLDGDGQFIGSQVRTAYDHFISQDIHVLEGARKSRTDPKFRSVVTFLVRLIVFVKSKSFPMDGNTPFRIYKFAALSLLVPRIPVGTRVPNIHIAIFTRRLKLIFTEFPITSIERRGSGGTGSTWGKFSSFLPNRRFIRFCLRSVREFI